MPTAPTRSGRARLDRRSRPDDLPDPPDRRARQRPRAGQPTCRARSPSSRPVTRSRGGRALPERGRHRGVEMGGRGSSTSSSSSRSRRREWLHASSTMPWPPSTADARRAPSSSARRGSRTSSASPRPARRCRRRRRTSIRSSCRASCSIRVVEPWLDVCRAAAADIRGVLEELPTRGEREPVLATGEGGDDTTAIDDAAERAVVRRLEGSIAPARSSCSSPRSWASGPSAMLDARRRRPDRRVRERQAWAPALLSLDRRRDGAAMGDVFFGYLYDFGTGEEWTATKGGGAQLDGKPLGEVRPKDKVEILAMEGTLSASVADKAEALVGYAHRFRIMGSLALSLCQLAAGRVDAVCSLRDARRSTSPLHSSSCGNAAFRSPSPTRAHGTSRRSTRPRDRSSSPRRRRS